tara:strand:- start:293 stop:562 length:270 start_codon:yes stop_codon:yes gene_type:complete
MATKPCSRVGVDCAGGVYTSTLSVNLFVNNAPAGSLNSIVAGHGPPPHIPNPIVTASSSVYSGGTPIARDTDVASCGHPTSSSSNVYIG